MSESGSETAAGTIRALLALDRLGPFVSSGVAGGVLDVLTMFALVELVGLGALLAKAFTWEVTVAFIFAINEQWAFANAGRSGRRRLVVRFLKSNLVRFGGFLVTLATLAVLVEGFQVWYMTANVVAIWLGAVVNYVFESIYTWEIHRQ